MTVNKTMKPKHIAIAGNIGAGKTTLCELLSNHYGWEVNYESTDDNPYLEDFYNDMSRWSFNLQIYFLNNRYRQIVAIQKGSKTVIQDRSIYEDAHIFAPNLHKMGLMATRDYHNYFDLFKLMSSQVNAPDLLIYLKASVPTLMNHIQKRGRDYESTMSLNYLNSLNDKYEDWIENYEEGKLLILDVNELDYKNNTEHRQLVIDEVSKHLKLDA
ncbi:MAG: deoxyadenosine/deoxycytidine kinase [Aureispira sp.]|jgi:deoxyadenosine/deoxycytidine kinase